MFSKAERFKDKGRPRFMAVLTILARWLTNIIIIEPEGPPPLLSHVKWTEISNAGATRFDKSERFRDGKTPGNTRQYAVASQLNNLFVTLDGGYPLADDTTLSVSDSLLLS